MKIIHTTDSLNIVKPVVTLGIFDGVHLAHQSIIRKLISRADDFSGESAIVTLWPHPRIVLNHEEDRIRLLNTLDEKIERLELTGVQNLIIIPFNEVLATMAFDQFIREILLGKIGMNHFVVGYNHQFGRNREGNFEKLQKLAQELKFGLSMQEPVLIEGTRVSSSIIRRLIMEGNLELANKFLGYTYYLTGKVISGNKQGRDIGYPTANIEVNDIYKLLPPKGVYAVFIETDNIVYKGMMNIGCRPTFNEDCLQDTLEVNLFDYDGDLYNKELRIYFVRKIREEKKFNSIEALRQQISNDKRLVNKILDSVKITNP